MKNWFSAERVPKKSKGGRSGRAGASKKELMELHKARRFILSRILLLLILAMMTVGVFALGGLLQGHLLDHSRFRLRHVEVQVDDDRNNASAQWVRDCLGIKQGTSLFDVDIEEKRSDFMEGAPSVKRMRITRVLPDTLRVVVMERVAVARLGTALVVDDEGYVFAGGYGASKLPLIEGYREKQIAEGSRVQGITLAAVQVAACYDVEGVDIEIVHVYAGNEDYVEAMTGQGQNIKLAWNGMGTFSDDARRNLSSRMKRVSDIFRCSQGQKIEVLDATISDVRIVGSSWE